MPQLSARPPAAAVQVQPPAKPAPVPLVWPARQPPEAFAASVATERGRAVAQGGAWAPVPVKPDSADGLHTPRFRVQDGVVVAAAGPDSAACKEEHRDTRAEQALQAALDVLPDWVLADVLRRRPGKDSRGAPTQEDDADGLAAHKAPTSPAVTASTSATSTPKGLVAAAAHTPGAMDAVAFGAAAGTEAAPGVRSCSGVAGCLDGPAAQPHPRQSRADQAFSSGMSACSREGSRAGARCSSNTCRAPSARSPQGSRAPSRPPMVGEANAAGRAGLGARNAAAPHSAPHGIANDRVASHQIHWADLLSEVEDLGAALRAHHVQSMEVLQGAQEQAANAFSAIAAAMEPGIGTVPGA